MRCLQTVRSGYLTLQENSSSCRRRKSRCSGTVPCARCAKLSLQCQYTAPYGRGLPPSPLPAPAAPEQQQFINNVRGQSHGSLTIPSASPQEAGSRLRGIEKHNKATQGQGPSSCDSPERGGTDLDGHYIGPSSGITFLNRAWRRLDQGHIISTPPDAEQEIAQQTPIFTFRGSPFLAPRDSSLNLPKQARGEQLVTRYFDDAVMTYRFLHQGTVDSWFNTIYAQGVVPFANTTESTARKAAVIFMVFAQVLLHEEREGINNKEHCGTR